MTYILFCSSHKEKIWLCKTWYIAFSYYEPLLWCFCILLKLESFSFPFIVIAWKTRPSQSIVFIFCGLWKQERHTDLEKHEVEGQTEVKLCLDWISHSCWIECMLLIAINTVFVRRNNEVCLFWKKSSRCTEALFYKKQLW